jgi:aspartate kinase
MPDGRIKTFSRGGSDISGALVARAISASVYENWTDVPGFMMADPHIVSGARIIDIITYRELRELAYMGAQVLHEDSIFPVRQAGIPIHIRNTNYPKAPGTLIVSRAESRPDRTITGIAGRKGFDVITIDKELMNSELGFGRRVLSVFEQHGVSFEHMPTGIDTLSVVVRDSELDGKLDTILADIRKSVDPDRVEVTRDLALIATVGEGMIRKPGTAARLFMGLASAGVNVRMIDQGSSELNIIVGVDNADFEKSIRAIYDAFQMGKRSYP